MTHTCIMFPLSILHVHVYVCYALCYLGEPFNVAILCSIQISHITAIDVTCKVLM